MVVTQRVIGLRLRTPALYRLTRSASYKECHGAGQPTEQGHRCGTSDNTDSSPGGKTKRTC
jgi:hypothetical protein